MTPVTRLTVDATLDNLSTADYADIWTELRQNHSLRNVIGVMESALSPARWQQYEKGECSLTRQMRNDLRRAVGMPLLPPTVADAVSQASPDAAVWLVGEGVPDTVIMVAGEPVTLHVNGAVQADVRTMPVTRVTWGKVARKRYIRPCIPESYAARLQGLENGYTWVDVVEAGLRTLENMP
jgi:hypothetical protein